MPDQATVEPLETQCLTASRPLKRGAFTQDNAKARQLASATARKTANQRQLAELERLQTELTLAKPIVLASIAKVAAIALTPDDEYRIDSLSRTRAQIARIEDKLGKSDDAKDLKALADAIARLRDVEQTLALRPKPGVRRPAPEKAPKKESGSGLVED